MQASDLDPALSGRGPAIIGLVTAVLAWGIAAASFYDYFLAVSKLPLGTSVRPMGLAMFVMGAVATGLFLAAPFSILALYLSKKRRATRDRLLSFIGLALDLALYPASLTIWNLIDRVTGMRPSP